METIMDTLLDHVRLDAIDQLKNTDKITKEQQDQMIEVIKEIIDLSNLARREGLLALEDLTKNMTSDLLKQLIILVVDGTFPHIIAEIGTNIYWTKSSKGPDAMMDYMYLRGMLGIQNGENPRILLEILLSLMPYAHREDYRAQIESLHQREGMDKLFSIHPAFQDEKTMESIHNLEHVVSKLPNRCIQRILHELDHRDLTICVYVFQQNIRKNILDNLSTGMAQAIMDDMALCQSISENTVYTSLIKVQDIINHLQKNGEICYALDENS